MSPEIQALNSRSSPEEKGTETNVMIEAIHEFRSTPIPEIYHIANRKPTEENPSKGRSRA